METTHGAQDLSAASKPIIGIGSVLLAVGFFMGAVCWIGVLLLIDSFEESTSLPRIAYVAGLVQIVVAMLFGIAGTLYIRRSRRAKVILCIAVAALILEAPLVVVAFSALIATR